MQDAEKYFCPPKRRARTTNNFKTMTFGKSLFTTQYRLRYAIYNPLNANDLTMDLTMLAYGNRQDAIKLSRSNNSDFCKH